LSDLSSTRSEYRQTVGCIVGRQGETELCVVGVLVELNTVTRDEQQRTPIATAKPTVFTLATFHYSLTPSRDNFKKVSQLTAVIIANLSSVEVFGHRDPSIVLLS